ncbi:hypothetical protein [Natronohydrobacter thiooxidans]|uniref:hypothetical protein n=1 Tax=Natronohydrobacter thiooxidans TaxID=87172 RepID=UPI0008FF09E9|nr:hypothetical protein [Natronohydrobacter thiooxidans]
MRLIALILGFLLVLSSLDPGQRASGGAVLSDLQPVGALSTGAEILARGEFRSEADPASGPYGLPDQGSAVGLAVLRAFALHGEIAHALGDVPRLLAQHPARAPPFLI